MEQKLMINCLKNSIKEICNHKFESEKRGFEKAALNYVDIIEQQNNEVISILEGLVSDVGNLLSEHDIEWQEAGYFEEAKRLLKKLRSN